MVAATPLVAPYGGLGTPIYFTDGVQTLRIQQREDGVSFDQIVISANSFYDVRPAATKNDTTIIAKSLRMASGATPSYTYRFPSIFPVRLTVTDNGGKHAADSTTATIH